MPNKTANYDLVKPLASEFYDVAVQNGNMDKIDAEMKNNADATALLQAALTDHTGNTTVHITAAERASWNGKAESSALAEHTANTTVHVTEAERTAWNGKADLGEDGKIPAAQLPELNYDLAGEAEDKVSAHNASQTAHSDIRETVQQALSKAAGAAKTEIVAYEGTATYGADNPCSVTFSFAPKLAVMLGQSANGSWWDNVNLHAGTSTGGYASRSYMVAACLPVTSAGATRSGFADSYCKDAYGYKSSDGKTFYWYNEVGASPQCNSSNATYYVLGIG